MADVQIIQGKIDRKRPQIAYYVVLYKKIGVNESNAVVRILTGSS